MREIPFGYRRSALDSNLILGRAISHGGAYYDVPNPHALPCRRFAVILADANARLGADAVCYSFIVVNFYGFFILCD